MRVRFEVNVKDTIAGLNATPAIVNRARNKALRKAMIDIEVASLQEVPVKTGNLASSFYSYLKQGTAVIGYKATYAMAVHENLSAFFLNGKAKFLEDPIRQYNQQLVANFNSILASMLNRR